MVQTTTVRRRPPWGSVGTCRVSNWMVGSGVQYLQAAACIMKISSSERTPCMVPSSRTPMRSRPPSVLAKAETERASFTASVTLYLKSCCWCSPCAIRSSIFKGVKNLRV